MDFDVFISHSHEDKAVADAACARLEAEGVRCWIAPRDVAPGADWAGALVEAIDKCRVMVVVFSSHANQSRQVHREVQQAFDHEKPVIPLRIESVAPERALSYYMQSIHWLDALTPPIEDHLERLVATVRPFAQARPEREAAAAAPAPAAVPVPVTTEANERAAESLQLQVAIQQKNVFSAGLMLLFIGTSFVVVALFWLSVHTEAAALAAFAAGMPLLLLAHNLVAQYRKFRVAGAVAFGLLLAAVFAALVLPPSFLPFELDHGSLMFLGIFLALNAVALFGVQQGRSDALALHSLRAIHWYVKRKWYIFMIAFLYAIPTWVLFYQITQSQVWLSGLIAAEVLSAAAVMIGYRQALGFGTQAQLPAPRAP